MNRILEVCLIAFTLTATQSLAGAQTLQKGISVELAATSAAQPEPDADNQDAWIVTVTSDGSLYFGTDEVSPSNLGYQMKSRPRMREQKLYIKVDARASFGGVERVLKAARANLFATSVLLTSQPEAATQGTMVPPRGLEVLLGEPRLESIAVQVLNSGQGSPTLKVNNTSVSPDALQDALEQLLQNRSEKVVVVSASGLVPFAEVVRVIETVHSTGAKVVLPAPRL